MSPFDTNCVFYTSVTHFTVTNTVTNVVTVTNSILTTPTLPGFLAVGLLSAVGFVVVSAVACLIAAGIWDSVAFAWRLFDNYAAAPLFRLYVELRYGRVYELKPPLGLNPFEPAKLTSLLSYRIRKFVFAVEETLFYRYCQEFRVQWLERFRPETPEN